MFTKIALILIFFTADGSGYRDVVGLFDIEQECESAKVELLKGWQGNDPSAFYFGVCAKPRPVKSVNI